MPVPGVRKQQLRGSRLATVVGWPLLVVSVLMVIDGIGSQPWGVMAVFAALALYSVIRIGHRARAAEQWQVNAH